MLLIWLEWLQMWPLAWAWPAAWASSAVVDGPWAWCAPPPVAGCGAPVSAHTEASGRSACGHDVDPVGNQIEIAIRSSSYCCSFFFLLTWGSCRCSA